MSSGPQGPGLGSSVPAGTDEPAKGKDGKEKLLHKGPVRAAAGERWRDPTLDEWPENDFRVFVGDLGNEVNDEHLSKAFGKYASFAKAKVRTGFHVNELYATVMGDGSAPACVLGAGLKRRAESMPSLVVGRESHRVTECRT